MAVLESAISVGVETTYNTFASPTRSYEGKADNFKREHQYLESVGFHAGMETVRDDRTKAVMLGGSGSLELDFMKHGMGLLLQGMADASTGPTQDGATTAYDQAHTSDSAASTTSYTIQWLRSIGSSTQVFTYTGCVVTGWSINQSNDGLLVLNVDFDFADENTTDAAATPSYVSTDPFVWAQADVLAGAASLGNATNFSFSADKAMKTDRRYLRNSSIKKQPVRNGVPAYEGSVDVEFDSTDLYDDFVANTHQSLEFKWVGDTDEIESGKTYEVSLLMPVVELRGETPSSSLSDLTMQSIPFKVLHDGSNPAYTLSVKSTDTAF